MAQVPIFINLLFFLTVLLTFFFLYKAAPSRKKLLLILIPWLILQSLLGLMSFYRHTDSLPPRFIFLFLPTFIFILVMFLTPAGKKFILSLHLKNLTLLHIIRVPVEICLYFLFIYNLVPQSMTFEGRNPDIISGLTAPLVYVWVFRTKKYKPRVLLAWNIICLVLLINIVTIALLSAETPFQQLSFDHPNTGITYFPFILLPSFVVPVVLFSHLASIYQLLNGYRKEKNDTYIS